MDAVLSFLAKDALALRYDLTVEGLDRIVAKGTERILLLPNHPALVDPLILAAHLLKDLHPVFLADSQQIDRPVLRWVAKKYGVRPLPDVKEFGSAARAEVERALADMAALLSNGRNVVLYPSGHIYRSRNEDLRGNSAAFRLIRAVAGLRVVLVRQTGLWGSSFGWASGAEPDVARVLRAGVGAMLASGVLLTPRRPVKIELFEPEDLPTGSRDELNEYLESFYNAEAQPNTYVPRSFWERGGVEVRPEPVYDDRARDTDGVPEGVRQIVQGHLGDLTGRSDFDDRQELSRDLGLDSLARAELLAWIEQQFGHHVSRATSLETVGDVLPAWMNYMDQAPREFSCNCLYWTIPDVDAFPPEARNVDIVAISGVHIGPLDEAAEALQPLRELGEPVLDLSGEYPFTAVQAIFDWVFPKNQLYNYWKSLYGDPISDEAADVIYEWVQQRPTNMIMFDIWAMGGAITDVAAEDSAMGDRSAPVTYVFNTSWVDPELTDDCLTWTRDFYEALLPYSPGGSYLNFPGFMGEEEGLVHRAYGRNYERLAHVKAAYDPQNLFSVNMNVQPA